MPTYRVHTTDGEVVDTLADSFSITGSYVFLILEGKITSFFLAPRRVTILNDFQIADQRPTVLSEPPETRTFIQF